VLKLSAKPNDKGRVQVS